MPEIADPPPRKPILARAPNRKINVKLAAELRANGDTWESIARAVGASSGDAVRQAMARRGVSTAIRTTIAKVSIERGKEALNKLSDETRASLARTVLTQSHNIERVKLKPNLKNISKIGQAIEPLARTAKIVHGWGEATKQAMVNMQVLGDVHLNEMFKEQEQVVDIQSGQTPQIQDNLSAANDHVQAVEPQDQPKEQTS